MSMELLLEPVTDVSECSQCLVHLWDPMLLSFSRMGANSVCCAAARSLLEGLVDRIRELEPVTPTY